MGKLTGGRRTCQPQEPRLRTARQEGRARAERRGSRYDRLPLGTQAEQGADPETRQLRVHIAVPQHLHHGRYRKRQDVSGLRVRDGGMQAVLLGKVHQAARPADGPVRRGRQARPRKRAAEVHQADATHHRRMAAVQAPRERGQVAAGGNPQETQEIVDHILFPVRGKGLVQPDMRRRKHPC